MGKQIKYDSGLVVKFSDRSLMTNACTTAIWYNRQPLKKDADLLNDIYVSGIKARQTEIRGQVKLLLRELTKGGL